MFRSQIRSETTHTHTHTMCARRQQALAAAGVQRGTAKQESYTHTALDQSSASQYQHKHHVRASSLALADSKRKKKVSAAFRRSTSDRTRPRRPGGFEPPENCAAPQSNAPEPGKFITISGCALPSVPHSPPSSVSVRRRAEGLSHDWDAQRDA